MTVTTDVRADLVRLMRATLADEQAHHDWTYRAIRPLPLPTGWKPGQAVVGDCSWGVRLLCLWAGAPDPMGTDYGEPYGNSTTIALHLRHLISPSDLLPGDIVTFGPGGDEHAAMVLEAGHDPLLWSLGHEGAPNVYRLSQDRRDKQYLRLPVPVYAPAPEDRLRAATGYWAWVQWRLAEGDWKYRYVKADPTVRPNVPRLIRPSWWVQLTVFLANRKRGNP